MWKRILLPICLIMSSANAQSSSTPEDGSELILDLGASAVRDVTVSNDGAYVVYVAEIDGNYDLFVLDIASGDIERLTSDPRDEIDAVWTSADQSIEFLIEEPSYQIRYLAFEAVIAND